MLVEEIIVSKQTISNNHEHFADVILAGVKYCYHLLQFPFLDPFPLKIILNVLISGARSGLRYQFDTEKLMDRKGIPQILCSDISDQGSDAPCGENRKIQSDIKAALLVALVVCANNSRFFFRYLFTDPDFKNNLFSVKSLLHPITLFFIVITRISSQKIVTSVF